MLKLQAQHWAGTAVASSLLASVYQRSFGNFQPLTLSLSLHVVVLVSDPLNLVQGIPNSVSLLFPGCIPRSQH